MAKAKVDLPPAEAVRALADAEGRIAIRVTPGARIGALEIVDGRLVAKVGAKPEDGKAKAAVQELLARALGVATSKLHLLRGATSREKQFRMEG